MYIEPSHTLARYIVTHVQAAGWVTLVSWSTHETYSYLKATSDRTSSDDQYHGSLLLPIAFLTPLLPAEDEVLLLRLNEKRPMPRRAPLRRVPSPSPSPLVAAAGKGSETAYPSISSSRV
jgi:hypothetical protein